MKFGDLYNKVFELFASLSFLCFLISSYASFNKFILVHKTNGIIWLIGFNVVSLGMQETTKLNKTSKLKKFVYWYNIVKGKNVILKIE